MEDYPYKDHTFKTGTGYFEPQSPREYGYDSPVEPLKLPESVNYVALRETCLSEAPFVNKTNRLFWKKWMDSSQYITILAASLKLVSSCINDLGSVNTWTLYDVAGNPIMEQMSVCIAEMLVMDRSRFSHSHDILFRRLPELLCYMIVGSLHASAGKHGRLYNSIRFREVMLDWLSELIGGIRITNCIRDREWLFIDANDVSVLVTHNPPNRSAPQSRQQELQQSSRSKTHTQSQRRKGRRHASHEAHAEDSQSLQDGDSLARSGNSIANSSTTGSQGSRLPVIHQSMSKCTSEPAFGSQGAAVSTFIVENSPLVNMYMNLGRNDSDSGYLCPNPCKVLLSHLPGRPLTSMQPDALLLPGAFREKKIQPQQFQDIMRESGTRRRKIMHQLRESRVTLRQDLQRTQEAYRVQLALLNKKPVSNKQLLAAASAVKTNSSTGAAAAVNPPVSNFLIADAGHKEDT